MQPLFFFFASATLHGEARSGEAKKIVAASVPSYFDRSFLKKVILIGEEIKRLLLYIVHGGTKAVSNKVLGLVYFAKFFGFDYCNIFVCIL